MKISNHKKVKAPKEIKCNWKVNKKTGAIFNKNMKNKMKVMKENTRS